MLQLVLAATLTLATDEDLRLQLTPVKARIQQGEATKVVLTWTALRPVRIVPGTEVLLLDDGTGYREYSEGGHGEDALVKPAGTLDPSTTRRTAYEIGMEALEQDPLKGPPVRYAFSQPGSYRVKVQYEGVSSSEVTIDVVLPSGEDADLFNTYLRDRPGLLTPWIGGDDDAKSLVLELLRQHPSSPHLARIGLLLAKWEFANAASRDTEAGVNPWEGEALRVFQDLQARDLRGTAFAEDHLLLVAKLSEELFDLPKVREAYLAVVEKFPNGVAVFEAEDWLKEHPLDTTPPALALAATPSSLWPPNHKLEPITVTVNVSDDQDPTPSVKLVSVSCDDGCNPAADIAGAALDTDDRAFELRSERQGFGSGRTYTITYEAADASGNKATATTTVTVPHDQGVATKKK